jgi:hypothetical protein
MRAMRREGEEERVLLGFVDDLIQHNNAYQYRNLPILSPKSRVELPSPVADAFQTMRTMQHCSCNY